MRFLAQFAISAVFFGCAAGAALAQGPGKEADEKSLFAGTWSGVGLQVSSAGKQSEWTVVVRLTSAEGGTVEYPSLGCSGTLTRTPNSRVYVEHITKGDCITGGTIALELLGDRRGFLWTGWATEAPDVSASAVLYPGEAPTS